MSSQVNETLSSTVDEARSKSARADVKSDFDNLRSDIGDLTSSVKRLAETEFGGTISEAREAGERGMAQVEASIKKNPTQAALIAAGVGFLVGLMIAR